MVSPIDLPVLQGLLAEADQHHAEWETDADSRVRKWAPLSDGDILAFDLRAAAQHRPGPFALQPGTDDAGYDETGRPVVARLRYAFVPVTGVLRRDGPTTDLIVIHRRTVVSVARRVDHADGVPAAFGALHRETDGATRIVLELETYERATSDGPIVAANVERKTSSGKTFRRLDDNRLVIASSEAHGVESIWSADAGVVYRRPLMTSEVFEAYADQHRSTHSRPAARARPPIPRTRATLPGVDPRVHPSERPGVRCGPGRHAARRGAPPPAGRTLGRARMGVGADGWA